MFRHPKVVYFGDIFFHPRCKQTKYDNELPNYIHLLANLAVIVYARGFMHAMENVHDYAIVRQAEIPINSNKILNKKCIYNFFSTH